MLVLTAAGIEPVTVPCAFVSVGRRVQAWMVTGPLGHAWSALVDIVLLWARYFANRARGRV
jgi:hypothetical protein